MLLIPTAPVAEIVEKETLPNLHFAQLDVLASLGDRQRRRADADRAALLGNAYHGKLDIYFQTSNGDTKRLATSVWAADSEHLTLKAGMALPLRAVIGFDFY